MKNHSSADKILSASNAFAINRLGISDSFESGRSLTLGLDYKVNYTNNDNDNDNDVGEKVKPDRYLN